MTTIAPYRQEIETIHAFFVDWYNGEVPEKAFERMEQAMAPDLEMISPGRGRLDRDAILEAVRDDYDRDEPEDFAIDIRNVELLEEGSEFGVVQYEEWQRIDGEWEGRVSVTLLRADDDAPEGFVWEYVQSTML